MTATANHPPTADSDIIRDAIARALFVDDWARKEEEKGNDRNWAGQDLMDLAPRTSRDAMRAADKFRNKVEALNGMSLDAIYWFILAETRRNHPHILPDRGVVNFGGFPSLEHFGHMMAMNALGHGVGLDDYNNLKAFRDYDIKLPHIEYYSGHLSMS